MSKIRRGLGEAAKENGANRVTLARTTAPHATQFSELLDFMLDVGFETTQMSRRFGSALLATRNF